MTLSEPVEGYEYLVVRVATLGNKSRYTNVTNIGAVRKVIHEFSVDSGIVIADVNTDVNNFEFVRPSERLAIQDWFNIVVARAKLKNRRKVR